VLTARLIMRRLGSAVLILLCIVVYSALFLLTLDTVGWLAALGVGCLSAPLLARVVVGSPLLVRLPAGQAPESAAPHPGARPTRASRLAAEAVLTGCLFLISVMIVGTYLWLGLIPSFVVMAITVLAAKIVARRISGTK
jgi:hypothetical protein